MSIHQRALAAGIVPGVVYKRLKRGVPLEFAFEKPSKRMYNGMTLRDIEKKYGISIKTLHSRWGAGIRDERLTKQRSGRRHRKKFMYKGEMTTIFDVAEKHGVCYNTAYDWFRKENGGEPLLPKKEYDVACDRESLEGLRPDQIRMLKEFENEGR